MDQDPTPTPSAGSGGKSGIFQHINTTVAGLTGLVVAVGGLAAATKGVLWDKDPPKEQAAAVAPVQAAAAQPAAAAAEAEPEAGDPLNYKGELVDDGKVLTIDWDGESWVLTEGDDDPVAYDETLSPDESKVMAVSNGYYLRWPIKGGEVDESEDKVKWRTYGSVEPTE